MLDFLIDLDTQIFLFFNSLHVPYFDYFMKAFSGKTIWIPMYASILYILFRRFGWKVALCYTIAIPLVILCADQICASLIRPLVERLRPSNLDNPINSLVHIVNGYRGGRYGFPSCHATNTFALATFASLLFANRRLSIFLFGWAIITCYSRVYLGVHYPGDLLVGGIIGATIAYIFYRVAKRVAKHFVAPLNTTPQQPNLQLSFRGTSINYQLSDAIITIGALTILGIAIYSLFACL